MDPWLDLCLHLTSVTENDVGGLTYEVLEEMWIYLDVLSHDENAYDYAVAVGGDVERQEDMGLSWQVGLQITAGGNAVSTLEGIVRALPYREDECGMPLDCLAAFETHYDDMAFEEEIYESLVELSVDPYSLIIEGLDVDFDSFISEDDPVPHVDAEEFVAKLQVVDVATVPADNMTCFYCWSSFAADKHMVELSTGRVMADHMPVKMPCPHGHLVGKMCLMQIIDANIHRCPVCRTDIVALVD